MSREITKDADALLEYLDDFKLENQNINPDYVKQLRLLHKKAYGYLLFIAEIELQNNEKEFFNKTSIEYLKETGSDIIQSIFCWVSGAYKPANMMLRSSVETFLKATLGNVNQNVFDEKSLFRVFDIAKNDSLFISPIGTKIYEGIHSGYKDLCMIAHSSIDIDLGTINSIQLLPRYSTTLATDYVQVFIRIIESFLKFLLLNFNFILADMHSLNKNVFLSTITLTSKKEVFEYIYQVDYTG